MNIKLSLFAFVLFLFSASFAFAQTGSSSLSPEVISCLKGAIGVTAFNEISSGSREPTASEIEKGKDCFKNFNLAQGNTSSGQKRGGVPSGLSAKTKACIEEVLGKKMEDLQGEPIEAQKQEIGKKCFGGITPGERGGGPGEMPAEAKSCLKNAVGGAAFEEIFSGSRPPTEAEMEKGKDCFKGFHPGGPGGPAGGGPSDMNPEARTCVEGILGQKMEEMRGEPSEEQKQKIGEKCFGGRGPGGGGSGGGPELNEETKSCLKANFGEEKFNKMMRGEFRPSEEEMRTIGPKCFKGGSPGGGPGGSPGGPPNISPETKSCIEGVLGQKVEEMREPSEEQKRQIGEKCFGGKAPSGTPPQGEGGISGSPPGSQPPSGPQISSEQQACVERILGGMRQPTPEEQTKISQECFGGTAPSAPPPS